jgi:hypothetical protein
MTCRTAAKLGTLSIGVVLAATCALADDARVTPPSPKLVRNAPAKKSSSFLARYLAPSVDARLRDSTAAALDFVNRSGNPWTRDPLAIGRVEQNALSATTNAFKRYAIERLGLDAWSLPLSGGLGGRGLDALRSDTPGPKLRFGFSHLAPKAEVSVPTGGARFAFSLDARGRIGMTFERAAGAFRLGATLDPVDRNATLGLVRRF